MKTAKLRDEKEVYDRQLHADVEAHKNLEENLQQLINREQELTSQENQMQARLKKTLEGVAKHKKELSQATDELNEISRKRQSSGFVENASSSSVFGRFSSFLDRLLPF